MTARDIERRAGFIRAAEGLTWPAARARVTEANRICARHRRAGPRLPEAIDLDDCTDGGSEAHPQDEWCEGCDLPTDACCCPETDEYDEDALQ